MLLEQELSDGVATTEGQHPILWQTSEPGMLVAEVGSYRLSAERVLPSAEYRFCIRKMSDQPHPIRSGTQPSLKDAMAMAERIVVGMINR